MKQREVIDQENTKWTCVQAFSMSEGTEAAKAEALSVNNNGTVTVVCTPGGGAKTVRLQLNEGWQEQMSDERLIDTIKSETRQ